MLRFSRFILILSACAVFLLGYLNTSHQLMLIACVCMCVANSIYSFEDIGNRILFFIFNLTFFLFLLGRPVVSFIRGDRWDYFTKEQICFALTSVFISLIFLFLGAVFVDVLLGKDEERVNFSSEHLKNVSGSFIYNLQNVSLTMFYFTEFFKLSVEFEKLFLMSGKRYEDFYMGLPQKLPSVFYIISELALPSLCIFLSTYPSKKKTFIPLCLYLISGLPMLKIGARGEFVLNAVFVFTYYFLRDHINKKCERQKWLGTFEKVFIIVAVPVMISLLSIYNYSRSNLQLKSKNPVFLIADFVYKQGVSFDVLSIGYGSIPKIYNGINKFYTFGNIVDYFKYSSISRFFLGTKDLPSGNSVEKALYSNSFSHSMSYQSRGQEYLEGRGWGSSYILETYADFGFLGIILYSLFIGMLLVLFIRFLKRSWLSSTISLMIISSIFFVPRAEATDFMLFLITPQFWFAVLVCWILTLLSIKQYSCCNFLRRRPHFEYYFKKGVRI